jgi:hypothetical protein
MIGLDAALPHRPLANGRRAQSAGDPLPKLSIASRAPVSTSPQGGVTRWIRSRFFSMRSRSSSLSEEPPKSVVIPDRVRRSRIPRSGNQRKTREAPYSLVRQEQGRRVPRRSFVLDRGSRDGAHAPRVRHDDDCIECIEPRRAAIKSRGKPPKGRLCSGRVECVDMRGQSSKSRRPLAQPCRAPFSS